MPSLLSFVFLHTFLLTSGAKYRDSRKPPATGRQVEKKILDDILGSKAYDPRIRPSGTNSTEKLTQIFCHRHLPTWSWKQCESTKSEDVNFGNENINTDSALACKEHVETTLFLQTNLDLPCNCVFRCSDSDFCQYFCERLL